ncbi:MAG: hypothetical protein HGB03_03775 [Candidatus Yonathbacteria bacterium]|nr:hypothetical protein [Candidatus Yonathbacteria bacterium]
MFSINSFLERFTQFVPDTHSVKKTCSVSISSICHISISEDVISYKQGTIFLSCRSTIKNEILLHKKEVLEDIQKNIPHIHIERII